MSEPNLYSVLPEYQTGPSEFIGTSIRTGNKQQNVILGGLNPDVVNVVSLKNQSTIGNTPQPVIAMYSFDLPHKLGGSLQPKSWLATNWWGEDIPNTLFHNFEDYIDETELGNSVVRSDSVTDFMLHGQLAIDYMRHNPDRQNATEQTVGCIALTDIPEDHTKDIRSNLRLIDYDLVTEFEEEKPSVYGDLAPECINPGVQLGLTPDFIFAVSMTAIQDIATSSSEGYTRNLFSSEYVRFIDAFERNIRDVSNIRKGEAGNNRSGLDRILQISTPVFIAQALESISKNIVKTG
jgi:hypothetical protein